MLPLLPDPVGFIWDQDRYEEFDQDQDVLPNTEGGVIYLIINSFIHLSIFECMPPPPRAPSHLHQDGQQQGVGAVQAALPTQLLHPRRQQQQPAVGHHGDEAQDLKGDLLVPWKQSAVTL